MKIIMLSIDSSIFRDGSEAQERMKEYGGIAEELHIIVYTAPGFNEKKISENVWIYPTNTVFKLFYFFNAYRIAKSIILPRSDKGPTLTEERSDLNGVGPWLVTSQDAFTNIVAIFLKKKFGIPFQAQIHTDFLSPNFRRESRKNYVRYLLYSRTIKKADCIRVVSQHLKKSIMEKFGIGDSKISVLPIFVDVEKIKNYQPTINLHEKYPGYDFIILLASRITREKRIDTACEAVLKIFKKVPKVQLIIAGEGPLKKEFKNKYEKSLPWQHIVFEDAVSYDILISYYKTADIFLVTSAYEGYGRTIIESLVAGLPVFSTDVGVAREIIKDGETGIIFKEHNSKEIASGITDVLLGNKLGGMKLKTREFAKNFSMPSKEEYLLNMKMDFKKCINSAD